MSKDGRIWLSHTGLEVLERCPKCFWLQYKKGVRQPEGIVSRLANRFDAVIKNYFEKYRVLGQFPPIVEGKFQGKLQSPFVEKYYFRVNDKYGFWGRLDECLENEKGELTPIDFKTASSDPREKEVLEAYQSQIDDYVFLIRENKYKVTGVGFLLYFFPDLSEELHDGFPMIMHVQKLTGNPENTAKRIEKAIAVLEKDMPDSSPTCPFCLYRSQVNKIEGV
ncbi:MAG: PD-(D/E)XK nuclease family protein [Patescibacteria group bacterium]|nr:PD-(D/E)XK nuclease family protein [Patescibacteria group bacterium]